MPIEHLGPYRIERLLGRGGMGAVYAGVHQETGQRAAIKVLAETLAADVRFRERFPRRSRNAQAAAAQEHRDLAGLR